MPSSGVMVDQEKNEKDEEEDIELADESASE